MQGMKAKASLSECSEAPFFFLQQAARKYAAGGIKINCEEEIT